MLENLKRSTNRQVLAGLAILIVIAMLALTYPRLFNTEDATQSKAAPPTTEVPSTSTTTIDLNEKQELKPKIIPLSAPEIPNTGRGQYFWLGQPTEPAGWPAPDVYYRDQLQWGRDIEKTPGVYDLSVFDKGLMEAKARGGRLSFRIMAFCPGCGENLTPQWLPRQSNGLPDWNNEEFLKSWDNLITAVGKKIGNNPRIGTVDVGGYGLWGEWHQYQYPGETINEPSALRLINAVLKAFPNKHVVINASDKKLFSLAMSNSSRLGIRWDCVGEGDPYNTDWIVDRWSIPEAAQRWKTRPVIGEWCNTDTTTMSRGLGYVNKYHFSTLSSGNRVRKFNELSKDEQNKFVEANKRAGFRYELNRIELPKRIANNKEFIITTDWRNVAVAPTYDTWKVEIELRDENGQVISSSGTNVDLKKLLPSNEPSSIESKLNFKDLQPGKYTVAVVVKDALAVVAPMRLAIEGRNPDGSYTLGEITVVEHAQS